MGSAIVETSKRLEIAKNFVNNFRDKVEGIILVGSVAYAPNLGVREDSDLDLIVIYKNIKDSVPLYFKNKDEKQYLLSIDLDGYIAKRKADNIPVSIHNMSSLALEKIVSGQYKSLDYYRQNSKSNTYCSLDFDGVKHAFNVVSKKVNRQPGVIRTDHVAFEVDGKYVIGNDMDKLLSKAEVLYDKNGKINFSLNNLWNNVAERLVEHRNTSGQNINIFEENISSILCTNERYSN